eukprot:IDg6056t1
MLKQSERLTEVAEEDMRLLLDAAKKMNGDSARAADGSDAKVVKEIRAIRKMRLKFTPDIDLVLASEVQLSGAHIAEWGKKEKMYGKVLERFMQSRQLQEIDLSRILIPTAKTLMDCMSYLLSERKVFVARMEKASGLEEEYDERAQTLDAILNQVKDKKEKSRTEREDKSELMRKLVKAGEETREMAMRRSTGSDDDDTPRKKAKRNFSLDSGALKLEAAVEKQLALDEKRLQLDCERFELAKRQSDDAREQNAKLMELLTAIVARSTDK